MKFNTGEVSRRDTENTEEIRNRQGDTQTRRQGEADFFSHSPCLPLSPSYFSFFFVFSVFSVPLWLT